MMIPAIRHLFTHKGFHHTSRWVMSLALITLSLTLPFGLVYAFILSPEDYLQGQTVRIMYIHVPSAWLSLALYTSMAVASGFFLITRLPMATHFATATSPVGAMFALIALVSGALWGKPTWGVYWVWDARLTSMLVLFFFYLAHIAISHAFLHSQQGQINSCILALTGTLTIPIIKWSVDWWNTLHQPASISFFQASSTINHAMLVPLAFMTIALTAYAVIMIILRMRLVMKQRILHNLQRQTIFQRP
ncbi:MAG: cytochrome c biogenesis protein CcsA [Alphaproteobacteria bacterium GM7ARS4]|nr:cytochrome c biogenesis protein CcsA [Alphaproteobacteria bacterium GM7ARS4]